MVRTQPPSPPHPDRLVARAGDDAAVGHGSTRVTSSVCPASVTTALQLNGGQLERAGFARSGRTCGTSAPRQRCRGRAAAGRARGPARPPAAPRRSARAAAAPRGLLACGSRACEARTSRLAHKPSAMGSSRQRCLSPSRRRRRGSTAFLRDVISSRRTARASRSRGPRASRRRCRAGHRAPSCTPSSHSSAWGERRCRGTESRRDGAHYARGASGTTGCAPTSEGADAVRALRDEVKPMLRSAHGAPARGLAVRGGARRRRRRTLVRAAIVSGGDAPRPDRAPRDETATRRAAADASPRRWSRPCRRPLRGVVHRDLKPENICFTGTDERRSS